MVAKFKALLVMAIPTIIAALVAFLFGRQQGENKIVSEANAKAVKDAEKAATTRVESVKVKADVQNEVISSSDGDVDRELLKWTRENSGNDNR